MMDNNIKVEEKLTKEEINFLKRKLKICFDVIVERTSAEEFDVENKDNFLKEFNPWQKDKGKKLIKKFVDNINKPDSNIDFSWLDILDTDERWEEFPADKLKKEIKRNKKKYTNMRYQIPTHFHGDIDSAIIFHCMENPKGYLGELSDSEIDDGFTEENLNEFYFYSAKIREEERGTVKEIIKERYQLEDVTVDSIEKIIYSKDKSALGREIEHIYKQNEDNGHYNFDFDNERGTNKTDLLKDFYYLKKYYSQLIQTNKELDFQKLKYKKKEVEEIAKKICNLEIYPFTCKSPNLGQGRIGEKILLNSDLSRLGAYIVLRRIYKYLINENPQNPQKPLFVFRKYDRAWEKLFNRIFKEVGVEDKFLQYLESHFFYCQTGQQGGGITSGNVISVHDFKALENIYKKLKELAFTEIFNLITEKED